MHHIRTTKTASNSTAVQIVKYVDRRMIIVNHVGSVHTVGDIETLKNIATDWIEKNTKQSSLFALDSKKSSQTILDQFEYVGVHFSFIYEVLHKILDRFKFFSFDNIILNDLVIMRLFEPASKLRSFELLQEYFGISHRRQTFYEELQKLVKLKNSVEKLVTKIAIEEFGFDFSLVFYDVTTLYFESFKADELREKIKKLGYEIEDTNEEYTLKNI